jgi:hypothetical protein
MVSVAGLQASLHCAGKWTIELISRSSVKDEYQISRFEPWSSQARRFS